MKEEDLSFTNMCHLLIIIVILSYDKTSIILGFNFFRDTLYIYY